MTLPPLPPGFASTRAGLHVVAEQIVAPARKPQNEIALRAWPGGFGTPEFDLDGETHVVRIEGIDLVHTAGGSADRVRIDSLAQAGELVADLLPELPSDDSVLDLDRGAADALADWFALGSDVLKALVAETAPEAASTQPTLWPEHFDIAIETGAEAEGRRANVGFSPGDDDHDKPYLYVGPWDQDVSGELWNAAGFTGAEAGYAELQAAEDPQARALAFCRERLGALG